MKFKIQPYLNRSLPGNEDISIYLEKSNVFIYVDLIFRVAVLTIGILANYFYQKENLPIAVSILLLNIIILYITIYYGKRRLKGIQIYLKQRIIAFSQFNQSTFQKKPDEYKLFIYSQRINLFKNLVYSFIFTACSLVMFYSILNTFWLIISGISMFTYTNILGFKYQGIFIKREIVKAYFQGKKLNGNEVKNLKEYLDQENFIQDKSVSFWNDKFIVSLKKDFNIYKEKLDTFLLESVFIGALTFTTFIQIMALDNNDKGQFINKVVSIFNNPIIKWFDNEHLHLQLDFGFGLLILGSVLTSIMYMVILIKRFPVIKSIENVKGSLDLAQFYNQKEEDILEKENKDYYTSQIQVQIAKCEEQKIILDSNFRIISFFRMSGLLCFFSVLLIATMMINFYFFVISTIIVSYVFIASRMMEENKLLKYFILDKKGKQRQTKNQRKFK